MILVLDVVLLVVLGLFVAGGVRRGPWAEVVTLGGLLTDPVTRFFLEWAGWWPILLALGGMAAVTVAVIRQPQALRWSLPWPLPWPRRAASLPASSAAPKPAIPAPAAGSSAGPGP